MIILVESRLSQLSSILYWMHLKMSKTVLSFILLSAVQSTLCIKFHIMTSLRSDCPGELAGEPCLTLQQYVSYPSHNPNITLEFELGNHSLKSMLTISSGTYFGLVATTNATINCYGLSSTNIRISQTLQTLTLKVLTSFSVEASNLGL